MLRRLALCLCVLSGASHAQDPVRFDSLDKGADGRPLQIDGYLYRPASGQRFVTLAMFHGCGGALTSRGQVSQRFRDNAALLNAMGYAVLLVDSFTPRGEREICTTPLKSRRIGEAQRWLDAYGALAYLRTRPDVVPERIGAIGFSHGATNAIQVMDDTLPPRREGRGGFTAAVALYPGCATIAAQKPPFRAYAPLLVLAGELDDWTPVAPCRELAERSRSRGEPLEIEVYAGAYHGFDETTPVRLRSDVVRSGHGVHVGGNPAAREAAHARMREFLARHLPLP